MFIEAIGYHAESLSVQHEMLSEEILELHLREDRATAVCGLLVLMNCEA